jgi:Methyltransferase domain
MALDIDAIRRPFMIYFRSKRMALFCKLFTIEDRTRIIDVGGYEMNWHLIKETPQVLLVNLEAEEWEKGRFRKTQGDGRKLCFATNSFDIAYSNSVIEHVGGLEAQIAFASEIRRIAHKYYVQVPYRWFWIEPHFGSLFLHYLPRSLFRKLVRYFTVWGLVTKPSQNQVDELLDYIRFLDRRELKSLFPDAEIHEERFLGFVKSLIAVRRD